MYFGGLFLQCAQEFFMGSKFGCGAFGLPVVSSPQVQWVPADEVYACVGLCCGKVSVRELGSLRGGDRFVPAAFDLDGDGGRRGGVEGCVGGNGFNEDVGPLARIARVGRLDDDFAVDDDGAARESEVEFVGDVGDEPPFEFGAPDYTAAGPFWGAFRDWCSFTVPQQIRVTTQV